MSITYAILALLWDEPRSGIDILHDLAQRDGRPPRPETIYPELRRLEEGGFVRGRDAGARRIYSIAERGSALLADQSEAAFAR